VLFLLFLFAADLVAQQRYELSKGWRCIRAKDAVMPGTTISDPATKLTGWMPAVVPGTVLTSLLHNKKIPDPFYGANNKQIPDISETGNDHYTYWFVTDFVEKVIPGGHVWLQFRGVNYGYDVFLNGKKLNIRREEGMYLRHTIDISPYLTKDGRNRVAVIVYPPDPAGNPNGGQGGDGVIARSVTNQYVAGWDWIQPVHDRNTGIWDKVYIEKTGPGNLENVHVETHVHGKRLKDGPQEPAKLEVTAEVTNWSDKALRGTVQFELDGGIVSRRVVVKPFSFEFVELPVVTVFEPRLWWPNGYGPQNLYQVKVRFVTDDAVTSDEETANFGLRELTTRWNTTTNSREIYVNGQRIFVKGANWIASDAMLRFSDERYDAEVRYHRDMNLNMIRVWGGGLTERPEFYDACDRYGLLVMQDLWMTGDCNGRWHDTYKKDDTTARRQYPDDHDLWLASCSDQVKMLRNHPSLALWCGGNEIRPPADMLRVVKDSLLPALDPNRYFFEYSNHDSMSLRAHDGPYTIQKDSYFWEHRSYGWNSEIGSVGIGDIESLRRFLPDANLVPPMYDVEARKWNADEMWQYHKYSSYDSAIEEYGHPLNIEDFATKAQLVNYNQYRSLMEGFTTRMWDWYTGVLVWKTQNPWTAMVGQMYDVYLDPNAAMFGLKTGAAPLHIIYNPRWKSVMIANNYPAQERKVLFSYSVTKAATTVMGKSDSVFIIPPDTCLMIGGAPDILRKVDGTDTMSGAFLNLKLLDAATKEIIDENLYWFPGRDGTYKWLSQIRPAYLTITAVSKGPGKIAVTLKNRSESNIAFFNRISLVDKQTKKRILPVFCNNNYISVPPQGERTVLIEYRSTGKVVPEVCVEGWNAKKVFVNIDKAK
jgi:hypothetical protein